ncbi:DUF2586 domain-containing protein [Geobacter sp. SVR]|uniref:DUF2586 domain-containing protein n=1 Tax=Geobacter sp. SVR TaxID=2495594 RepID=UPI00143EFA21|nr:DUF2586 domain-containing protein [Geobacter sp. SVR]BCS55196.1 hypothetical protein GSVR_35040 [Geobacter sp. SVR]GCF85997.1 hypothetical protein GSbR_25970 [Geobacter sp. SVR]
MNDVFEFLIDGTSGISPGGVEGACIMVGVCSLGEVGKGYLLGKSSDLDTLLGVGPLVDRLRDAFAPGGQAPVIIAVPVAGLPGGYITPVEHTGTGPTATVSGAPAGNSTAVVQIVVGGALATATYKLSENGGATWGETTATPANGQIAIGTSGATLVLAAGVHVAGDTYATTVRVPIGPVTRVGTGPVITAAGTVKAAAEVQLRIISAGGRNTGTYQLSLDGGDSWGGLRTIPVDGLIAVGSTGVTITFPDNDAVAGDTYSFRIEEPVPSVAAVIEALETPLSLYDMEFVHVVGPSDSSDWAALGVRADELWNAHRPTFFLAETRLPYDGESIDDWTAALVSERQGFAHRFVSVCSAYGEISDSTGKRITRNAAGLATGRLLAIPVMRALGRVLDGPVSQLTLSDLYTSAHQSTLETAGYITARRYAGLSGVYWGDERTMADVTSDFQFLTVLRVVFKATRLSRIAALRSMYDEAGDPTLGANAAGLAYLKTGIEAALNTMVRAIPRELAAHQITIPPNQDIVNNGVAVEMTLIGIPIIRKIKLYANYVYAGGAFDPRLQ